MNKPIVVVHVSIVDAKCQLNMTTFEPDGRVALEFKPLAWDGPPSAEEISSLLRKQAENLIKFLDGDESVLLGG